MSSHLFLRFTSLVAVTSLSLAVVACSGGADSTPTSGEPSGSGTGTSNGNGSGNGSKSGNTTGTPTSPANPQPPTTSTPPTTTNPPTTTCKTIANTAAAAPATMVAADAPAATGGTVPDGTYHLKKITLYTGADGSSGPLTLSIKQTIEVASGTVHVAEDANGKASTLTETYVINGSSMTFTQKCPVAKPGDTVEFSGAGTVLTLFLPNDLNQIAEFTYEP